MKKIDLRKNETVFSIWHLAFGKKSKKQTPNAKRKPASL